MAAGHGSLLTTVAGQTEPSGHRGLLAGKETGCEVWTRLNAANRVGVTRGTLEERRNPLAII